MDETTTPDSKDSSTAGGVARAVEPQLVVVPPPEERVKRILEKVFAHAVYKSAAAQAMRGTAGLNFRELAAGVKQVAAGEHASLGLSAFLEWFSMIDPTLVTEAYTHAPSRPRTLKQWEKDGMFHASGELVPKGTVGEWAINQLSAEDKQNAKTAKRRASSKEILARGRTRVVVNSRPFRDVFDDASDALVAANDPPVVFRQGDHLVRLSYTDAGGWGIKEYAVADLRVRLSRTADYVQEHPDGQSSVVYQDVYPPKDVVTAVLASAPEELPELSSVVSVPFFTNDGTLVLENGYYPDAQVYMKLDPRLAKLDIPETPNDADLAEAKGWVEELVCDFSFATPGDRAHWFALLFERVVRPMVDGPYPLHYVEAPVPNSGKTKLVDIASIVATGREAAKSALPFQEEEREKTVIAQLRSGTEFICFDNVKGKIDSAVLENLLTSTEFEGRILGRSEKTKLRNLTSISMTLNQGANPSVDLARRGVRSRIDTGLENPATRDVSAFKHYPLLPFVKQTREKSVRSILILVQDWVLKGKKNCSGRPLDSFEEWSRIIGGILENAGLAEGFLDPTLKIEADIGESEEKLDFYEAWYSRYNTAKLHAQAILDVANPTGSYRPEFLPSLLENNKRPIYAIRSWLKQNAGVHCGPFIMQKTFDSNSKSFKYWLEMPANAATFATPETSGPGELKPLLMFQNSKVKDVF